MCSNKCSEPIFFSKLSLKIFLSVIIQSFEYFKKIHKRMYKKLLCSIESAQFIGTYLYLELSTILYFVVSNMQVYVPIFSYYNYSNYTKNLVYSIFNF